MFLYTETVCFLTETLPLCRYLVISNMLCLFYSVGLLALGRVLVHLTCPVYLCTYVYVLHAPGNFVVIILKVDLITATHTPLGLCVAVYCNQKQLLFMLALTIETARTDSFVHI